MFPHQALSPSVSLAYLQGRTDTRACLQMKLYGCCEALIRLCSEVQRMQQGKLQIMQDLWHGRQRVLVSMSSREVSCEGSSLAPERG